MIPPVSRLRVAGVVAAVSGALLVAGAAAWVVGGNAVAARRERAAAREWEAAFGPHAALVRRYTVPESSASARRVEEIAKEMGFDLALRSDGRRARGPLMDDEIAALRTYENGELTRTAAAPPSPPPRVVDLLASRRAALSTLEELLSSAPPPRWACDPSGSPEDWPTLPLAAHLQMLRLLVADSLFFSSKGEDAAGAAALEASWRLSSSLSARPEVTSQVVATAASRLLVGALRRTGGSRRVWAPRLADAGSRRWLLDALVLAHRSPGGAPVRTELPRDVGWWHVRALAAVREPLERIRDSDFDEGWRAALSTLRDAPAFREDSDAATVAASVRPSFVNLRNAFARADRLALDAELTAKILRLEEARKGSGSWPEPSPEIASSRFPGLSWNYAVSGDTMTISLSRDLPSPFSKNSLVLPLSFSSGAPRP